MDCVFCKIIKGEIPCLKVYEDEHSFAFLSIEPAVPKGGHTLVIPKKHYELISEIPDEELASLMKSLKKVSKAVLKFGEGMNLVQNNKKAAGQIVSHMHFHLIPRFEGDNIKFNYWEGNKLSEKEMVRIQKEIKRLLN